MTLDVPLDKVITIDRNDAEHFRGVRARFLPSLSSVPLSFSPSHSLYTFFLLSIFFSFSLI